MNLRQTANRTKYDLAASIYDVIAFMMSLGQAQRIYREVARTLDIGSGATVVEFGCGPASVVPYLLERVDRSSHIIGVDFSEEMIRLANRKKSANGWENVEFQCLDMHDYPEDAKVDAVIFCLALTAIPDTLKVLEKTLSILRPGGQLVIADSFPMRTRWRHAFTNAYISLKSLVVGAKPSDAALTFINERMVDVRVSHLLGGVYTLVSARKGG